MKKTILNALFWSLIIFGLGVWTGKSIFQVPSNIERADSLIARERMTIDSLQSLVEMQNLELVKLEEKRDSEQVIAKREIERIKSLRAKESKKYLEEKILSENAEADTLSFIFTPSGDSLFVAGLKEVQTINGLLEKGERLEGELEIADSMLVLKDSIIVEKDSIIESHEKIESAMEEKNNALQKELKKSKKSKRLWQGGVGILGICCLLLLL